jgi:acetoacetyl-CoA synthetase
MSHYADQKEDQNQPKIFPSPEFFPGTKLNLAGSILNNKDPNMTAILELPEGSLEATEITWGALRARVEAVADAMRSSGVTLGDRVAAVIANTADAIIFCLATLSIGAIWSSISPDFGAKGIMDRLIQVKPKLIFTNTSVVYSGKKRDLMPTVTVMANAMAQDLALVNVIVTSSDKKLAASVSKGISIDAFLEQGLGRKLQFEQLPFNQPAFIFYSSGTVRAPVWTSEQSKAESSIRLGPLNVSCTVLG